MVDLPGVVAALAAGGVLSLGLGLALAYDGARRLRFRRRALSSFERVDATVVDAAVHESPTGDGRAIPHVEYEYTVDGETYTSRRLWPTREATPGRVDRDAARRLVEDHPEGAEVIARYDPDDPTTAYLIGQVDATWPQLELLAGVVLVGGFLVAATQLYAQLG